MAGLSLLVALALPRASSAHHSFAAEFDADKPITLTGTIIKVQWTNPHGRLFVDAKDATGTTVNWELELGSVNALMRNNGWTRTTLKAGDTITVGGYLARDTPHLANVASVTLADGRKFVMPGALPPGTAPPR